MKKLDIYPLKSQFRKSEKLSFKVQMSELDYIIAEVKVYHLDDVVYSSAHKIDSSKDFDLDLYLEEGSYAIELITDNGRSMTAFEIEDDWKKRPRYGFLSDFNNENIGNNKYIETFLKLHINVVQYYDWMYQHNDLISETDEFIDLMGRKLNQGVVKDRTRLCKKHNIKNIAYGAIYGASNEFYASHKEWAFYNTSGDPINFIDVFKIMNFTETSGWRNHLINEYKKAIDMMGFDGIHMDTYGYPKVSLDYDKNIVYLDEHFNSLINKTKEELSENCESSELIFNNVGAWPVNTTYKARQSALYIEVWDPMSTYNHLIELINQVKLLTKEKELIISAYLKPYYEKKSKNALNAHKLLASVLYACGAFHLIMGEDKKVLRTGYYCDYGELDDNDFEETRKYYDFNTMYSEILYDRDLTNVSQTHMCGDNLEYIFKNVDVSPTAEKDKVLTIIKEKKQRKVIHLINLKGSDNVKWNDFHNDRIPVSDLEVSVLTLGEIENIYSCSPDKGMLPNKLEYNIEKTERGNVITFKVDNLLFWDMIVINEK